MVSARTVVAPFGVGLIDDDVAVRGLLAERLSAAVDIVVVGEAGSIGEALVKLVSPDLEVLVVESSLGEEVCAGFRDAGHRVGCVLVASFPGATGGAVDGVWLKEVLGDGLEEEIRRVGRGIRATDS